MAKMFYSAKEAAEKLGRNENDLKDLVRAGKLREFRDAGTVNYKVSDVDSLSKGSPPAPKPGAAPAKSGVSKSPAGSKAGSSISSASQSGEILLEPAEDSGISLMPSGSDIMSLEAVDADDTAVGARAQRRKKEGSKGGSSVPSVGINVFDDDELDEHVDPLAQTAVTDVAGLALDGIGSGSGILDLTRESDDTSLGAELLEEIYTGEETVEETGGTMEMGDDTRAGLDEAVGVKENAEEAVTPKRKEKGGGTTVSTAIRPRTTATATTVVEYAPDAVSASLTAAMVVAVAVMWIAGIAAMAMLQGVTPSLVGWMHSNLMIFAGAALGVTGIAAAIAYFMAKRSE